MRKAERRRRNLRSKRKWLKKNPRYPRQYFLRNKRRVNAARRRWRRRNPDKEAAQKRRWRAKHRAEIRAKYFRKTYGISIEQFEEMLIGQQGRCAICMDKPAMLCVDHCHSTKKVRGLLCKRCNHGIGLFKEDVERLMNAINYLRLHAQ